MGVARMPTHGSCRPKVSTVAGAPSRSIDKQGRPVIVTTHGRHDPGVGIRAAPIAEAMLACVLIDHALRHRAQNAGVSVATPRLAARAPGTIQDLPRSASAIDDPDPDEA